MTIIFYNLFILITVVQSIISASENYQELTNGAFKQKLVKEIEMKMEPDSFENNILSHLFAIWADHCDPEELYKLKKSLLDEDKYGMPNKLAWRVMSEALLHEDTIFFYDAKHHSVTFSSNKGSIIVHSLKENESLTNYFNFFAEYSDCVVDGSSSDSQEKEVVNCFKEWLNVKFRGNLKDLVDFYRKVERMNKINDERSGTGFSIAPSSVDMGVIQEPSVVLEKALLFGCVGVLTSGFVGVTIFFIFKSINKHKLNVKPRNDKKKKSSYEINV